jgi:uncharacterized protein (TIGR02757 family)
LIHTFDFAAHRRSDPVAFVHRHRDPHDQEVVALVAALLAFGRVESIRRSVERVLDALGPRPAETVDRSDRKALERRLRGFVHRTFRGPDVAAMLANAGRVRARHGNVGAAFARHLDEAGDLREALARLSDALRGRGAGRGLAHLVADPRAGSACKRSLLLLRWMCRPADGVDLGLWPVSPARLVIPVDTHVHRIAKNLGLTTRASASWRTAEEITARLRTFDGEDPVKYDFALCHLGVSRQCPSRRDPQRCEGCGLRTVCLHWAGGDASR